MSAKLEKLRAEYYKTVRVLLLSTDPIEKRVAKNRMNVLWWQIIDEELK